MTTLVIGASGATGRHLVQQLLNQGQKVKVIVRSIENLPAWKDDKNITIIQASILEMDINTLANYLKDCNAVASCLGHNLTFKGIFGKPRKLVTDAVKLLCDAIKENHPQQPVKFALMNTTGNRNKDLKEKISLGEQLVVGLIRMLVPPHSDNEQAAEYLRIRIGQNDKDIEWIAIRPDGLINEDSVSEYEIHRSPTRSAIFNAGKVSRINVGHFMAHLILNADLWQKWKGQMPVIYSREF